MLYHFNFFFFYLERVGKERLKIGVLGSLVEEII